MRWSVVLLGCLLVIQAYGSQVGTRLCNSDWIKVSFAAFFCYRPTCFSVGAAVTRIN